MKVTTRKYKQIVMKRYKQLFRPRGNHEAYQRLVKNSLKVDDEGKERLESDTKSKP